MTDQEQIEQLKAQVNQFKRGVESFNKTRSMNELLKAYSEAPEQCLAEVKAKAIEDALDVVKNSSYALLILRGYAEQIREQAK